MADASPPHDAAPAAPASDGRGRPAPDEVWAAVRADYAAGLPAPECCRRHGVGLTSLRDRAAREGWRRADQPWVPPTRLDADDEGAALAAWVENDLDRVGMPELSWVAHRRMMRAVLRGDAAGALRWLRIRDAMDAEADDDARWCAEEDAIGRDILERAEMARSDAAREADSPDGSDGSDGVFHQPT
ncbi:MAG TPA: hypothetical protein VGB49_09075 [Caulobacteraceae bacterium]|jgi:hypothetical protein